MKKLIFILSFLFCTHIFIFGQIYVPNGINGVSTSTNGNVGVGSNSPVGLFDVYGATTPNFRLRSPNASLDIGVATSNGAFAPYARNGNVILRLLGGVNEEKGLLFHLPTNLGNGKSYFKFGDDLNGAWLSLYNNKKMIINGMVGIGTSNPTRPLEVNGTIRAKEIIVESGWADFVFDSSYQLRPLHEVESHIQTYRCLPDIPSEAEVKENGIGLSEMNTKLLQKVEELTLYVIQQEKELMRMKEELENMKKGDSN